MSPCSLLAGGARNGALLAAVALPGAPAPDLVLDAGPAARAFRVDPEGRLVTIRIDGERSALPVVSNEFRFLLSDGRELQPGDFDAAQVVALPDSIEGRGFAVRYGSSSHPFAVLAAYYSDGETPWTHKQVRLEATGLVDAELRVVEIEVERIALMDEGRFEGGGCGQIARSPHGLFAALEHPLGEAAVDGRGVTLRHFPGTTARASDATSAWPWSMRAVVGCALDVKSIVKSHAATIGRSVEPAWIVAPAAPGAAMDGDLLAPFDSLASRAEELLGVKPRHWFLRPDDFDPERPFSPRADRFPAGIAALAAAAGLRGASLGATLPLARDGIPLDLADPELRRTALRELVSHLRDAEGRLQAIGWLAHAPPETLSRSNPAAAAASERLVDGWIELWRTERQLAAGAVLSLTAAPRIEGETEPSPFWRLHVDHVGPAFVHSGFDGSERETMAAALLALPDGPPLRAVPPPERAQEAAWRTTVPAIARWLDARRAAGAEPVVIVNREPQPKEFDLPAGAGTWLRTWPWCEVVRRGGNEAKKLSLAPGEIAVLEPATALAGLGWVPAYGRFAAQAREDRRESIDLLVEPKSTQPFHWLDLASGSLGEAAKVGAGGAYGLREPGSPFLAQRGELARGEDGRTRVTVTFATRCHRGERVSVVAAVSGEPGTTDVRAIEPKIRVERRVTSAPDSSGCAWTEFAFELGETSEAPALALEIAPGGGGSGPPRLVLRAERVDSLEPVRLRAPGPRGVLPPLPPASLARERREVIVLHDGPLGEPVRVETGESH